MDKRLELLIAARKGISDYLSTTRGANAFGASPVITSNSEDGISVTSSDGHAYVLSIRRLMKRRDPTDIVSPELMAKYNKFKG